MVPSRMKIERILCPTDFSEFSERALSRAVRLARWFEASITVVHVVPTPLWVVTADAGSPYSVPGDLLRVQRQEVAEALEGFVAPYRGEGVPIQTQMLDGEPSRLIQKTAREWPADLVVMGTHGRGGFEHLLLGSVTEKVLRRATCPVLTVGRAAPPTHDGSLFCRILCALDLTEASAGTLEVGLSLAEENMGRVTLLHVLAGLPGQYGPERYRALPEVVRIRKELIEEAEDRLRRSVPEVARDFCSVTERVEEGTPWREVLRVAEQTGAELIVMGAHSRGPVDRAFFGSTVSQVVREARCPVLVVRETPTHPTVADEVPAVTAMPSPLAGAPLH
jgi:nucleotide-binding universal stress UspA family protein